MESNDTRLNSDNNRYVPNTSEVIKFLATISLESGEQAASVLVARLVQRNIEKGQQNSKNH